MDVINWANYNYDEFELFCSALLSFEFGKNYQPFSAPGRDGGIDGSFTGTYYGHTGKWRFQFKFFHSARSKAINDLRFLVKEEARKLNDENYFVLITNVELLPQDLKSISENFDEQIRAADRSCTFLLWDGAKIYNLFIQYPILSLWLDEGFSTAQLRPYKDVYEANLKTQDFNPSSMSTYFVGREKDLEDLNNFLYSNSLMAVITGEAGVGKTRLALEFFQVLIDQSNEWIALVLVNHNFNYDKIYRSLFPGRKYIVFIDDAHTFDPKLIADIRAIASHLKNVKLVLTTRNLRTSSTISLLKEYEQEKLLSINLTELSRPETEKVFLRYIGQSDYRFFINELITISFGRPILIVAMLSAMKNNVSINSIKEQNFLKNYVLNYFEEYVNKVNEEAGIDRINIRRLIQAVALLEPFNFNDTEIISKISSLLELQQSQVTASLQILIRFSYVNGRYEQSIKPDYYSDIALLDIDPNEVVRFMTEFVFLSSNIIINLSSVDEAKKDDSHTLNMILRIYINLIKSRNEIDTIKKILTTIIAITFTKQDIAKETVDMYLNCLSIDNHPLYFEYKEDKSQNYYSASSAIGIIITILDRLYETSANTDFVYRKAFRLYTLTEEKNVASIFKFDKRDVLRNFSMERQNFFLTEFTRKFKKYNTAELEFGLNCLKGFTALDFTLTEASAANQNSISIITYFLPNSNTVKKFRKGVIELLIKIYESKEAGVIRAEALKIILDFPRGMLATRRNNKPYQNDAEIKLILKFLKNIAETFNLSEQKEILEKLHWFKRWEISGELLPLVNEVNEALKPKNLIERLSQLFSKAEMQVFGTRNTEEYTEQKCKELVESEDKEVLTEAIVEFLKLQDSPPYAYWSFQTALERNYPEYAKALYHKLYQHFTTLYITYASRILGTFYYYHHDEMFYWEQIDILQNLNSIDADNITLAIYAQRVPDMTTVTNRDAEAIIQVFEKGNKENDYYLAMAIQLLFSAQHHDALSVSQRFLDRADQRQTGIFFIRLSDNKTVSEDQMGNLILNHTVKYELSYEIEMCLNRVLLAKGVDVVFDYLLKRFEHKMQLVVSTRSLSGYEFLPDGEYSHLFDGNTDYRMIMFLKAIDWYTNLDIDKMHFFYAKDLLTYLQPGQSITTDLFELFETLLNDHAEDAVRLERILDAISIFHSKNENLVQLVIDIYSAVNDYQNTDLETFKNLRYECYSALTTMGVKSGTVGMPFQVDLDLKQLLESFIANLDETMPVRQFLKDVLKGVETEIQQGLDRENLTW